jgi:pyridoxal phosphate enzyme (YggS family)
MDAGRLTTILQQAERYHAQLVVVSKSQSVDSIRQVYAHGIRHFGENYARELCHKQSQLPADIHWHFIGHLQTNKVRKIIPFIALIQSADSRHLLDVLEKEAGRYQRSIPCLLQVHIAREESKTGIKPERLDEFIEQIMVNSHPHIQLVGLMGMATLTDDEQQIRKEFRMLRQLFENARQRMPSFHILSMGMTSDYHIALEEGSTMIRIGSAIFGERK